MAAEMQTHSSGGRMKIGDLVRIPDDERFDDSGLIGLVQWINENYPPTCGLLIENKLAVYDARHVEVINEDR